MSEGLEREIQLITQHRTEGMRTHALQKVLHDMWNIIRVQQQAITQLEAKEKHLAKLYNELADEVDRRTGDHK